MQQADNRLKQWLAARRPAITRLFYVWIGLHLLYIIIINAVGTYASYNEFHHLPDHTPKYLYTPLCRYYGRYTGAETGYGFFGINVRSNGMLIGESGGQMLTADFNSYETSLRFFSMGNALTDDYIKPGVKDSIPELSNLIFKNIAVTLYDKHYCEDSTVFLSYNVLQFPTLNAIRRGTPPAYQLMKLMNANYSLLPHER